MACSAVLPHHARPDGRRVIMEDDKAKLAKTIAEYERLKKLLRDLDAKANAVDGRLVEIERQLPDGLPQGRAFRP